MKASCQIELFMFTVTEDLLYVHMLHTGMILWGGALKLMKLWMS